MPSVAFSLAEGGAGGFESARRIAELVAARVLVEGLPAKTLLNVNVPRGEVRGIRMTRLGHRVYREKVVEEVDPRGRATSDIATVLECTQPPDGRCSTRVAEL